MAHSMDHPHRPSSTPPILPYFTFHIPPHPLKTQNHVLEPSTSTIPPKRQLFQNGLKIIPSIPKFTIFVPEITSVTPKITPSPPVLRTCPYPFPPLPPPSTPNSFPTHPQYPCLKMSGPHVGISQF